MSNFQINHPQHRYHEFFNMVAHEIKTPITVLKAYIQILTNQLEKEKASQYLGVTEKMDLQVDKLLDLLSDLQGGMQSDSQILHCFMNDFDIVESVQLCVDAAKATYPAWNLEFNTERKHLNLQGDHARIEQVISNFLINAIKYSNGDRHISIDCKLE